MRCSLHLSLLGKKKYRKQPNQSNNEVTKETEKNQQSTQPISGLARSCPPALVVRRAVPSERSDGMISVLDGLAWAGAF